MVRQGAVLLRLVCIIVFGWPSRNTAGLDHAPETMHHESKRFAQQWDL